jgi:autotransporter-associated beta strand protein
VKTELTIVKLFIVLCSAFATTAVFGQGTGNALQTNFIWIAPGANIDLATAANWMPTGVPVPARNNTSSDYGDIMTFDGQTAGPVSATSNTGAQTGSSVGGTTPGLYLHLTANQTNSVTFHTTVQNSASSGIRFNSLTIDAGAGSFYFGKGSTTNALDTIWGTSNPESHGLTNNSANPAYILPDLRWRLGAGGAHTFVFGGTGDWYITNDLGSIGGAATLIAKAGSGTMYWTAGHNLYWGSVTAIATPLTILGGTLVLNSGGLFPATTTINHIGCLLVFDAVGGTQTISNPIHGTGNLKVNNGTLTLSGQNDFTGNITLSGGELIANRAENLGVNGPLGNGGWISFTGGTLGFSVNNTCDYSPRFTNAPGQAISIDTSGLNVTFTNALTSSGGTLTKLGVGTLTLNGTNTYTGTTTVNNGTLVVNSLGGDLKVSGGILAPASTGSVGTLTVAGSMTISSGTILATLNKSLSPSNSFVSVGGTINNSGGTLKLLNCGPNLAVGDKFSIFNQTVGSSTLTIVSPGFTVNNNLAVDGSVTVSSIAPPANLTAMLSGGNLNLSWPSTYMGLHLQLQTNPLTIGLSTNWATISGTDASNSYSTQMLKSNAVFYRLAP